MGSETMREHWLEMARKHEATFRRLSQKFANGAVSERAVIRAAERMEFARAMVRDTEQTA